MKKKGFTDKDIAAQLLQQGYAEQEVHSAFRVKPLLRSYLFWIIIGGLFIFLNILLLFSVREPYPADVYVNELRFIEKNSSVNINHASGGTAFFEADDDLQYDDGSVETVFTHHAYYEGQLFYNAYARDGKTLMRYGPNMVPGDGIIEIFIIEKVLEGEAVVHVFVDEDWRRKISNTNIYYGPHFEHQLMFNYSMQTNGIYVMTFTDDPDRFSDNYRLHYGGIIVGDMTKDNYLTATAVKFI